MTPSEKILDRASKGECPFCAKVLTNPNDKVETSTVEWCGTKMKSCSSHHYEG